MPVAALHRCVRMCMHAEIAGLNTDRIPAACYDTIVIFRCLHVSELNGHG